MTDKTSSLNEIQVEQFLKDSVEIEPTLLQEEYVRVPADIAYWNERYSVALRAHLMAKLTLDRIFAGVQIETRETLLAEGSKVTESTVAAKVELNPKYQQARLAVIDTEVEAARIKGVGYAVSAKREMIVSLGAHLRIELQNDPALRDFKKAQRIEREG
jgi:hypothetical protein